MTKLRCTICVLLTGSLLAAGEAAIAQTRAVDATSFDVGFESQQSDTSGSTSSGKLGLNAGFTMPLGDLLGAFVSASHAQWNVKSRDILDSPGSEGTTSACDYDASNYDAGLFVRRPALGRFGMSYGAGRLSSGCGDHSSFAPAGSDALHTSHYQFDAEFYLRDLTLAASHTTTDLEDGPTLDSTSVMVSWYPLDSLRVSVTGHDLYDRDFYGAMVEHQPEFLGDALGVWLGYELTDDFPRTRTMRLGVSYYFGALIDLKTRDRRYR